MTANEKPAVVVGVDGSDNGRRAMAWALDEAKARGLSCLLVHAVDFGFAAASPYAGVTFDQLRDAGQAVLDTELAIARDAGVPVEGRLVISSAAQALIDASRDAALLVVGSRGRGGFTGMLLGSVSTACVHHAHCPVLVTRPPEPETTKT
ncbi:MAG TPA: universal stress protein [Acidimicrobiales bacterium]|nr:universal stress protein [Acidimicrobiales bacterium]